MENFLHTFLFFSSHMHSWSNISISDMPFFVKLYSTLGGIVYAGGNIDIGDILNRLQQLK